jgi:hypothetical protein
MEEQHLLDPCEVSETTLGVERGEKGEFPMEYTSEMSCTMSCPMAGVYAGTVEPGLAGSAARYSTVSELLLVLLVLLIHGLVYPA